MNRYINNSQIPQPIRKILPAISDFTYVFKKNDRLDKIANKFYNDPTLAWIIMCANPEWDNEFELTEGNEIRIPFPLSRVFASWKIENEI